MPTNISEKLRK